MTAPECPRGHGRMFAESVSTRLVEWLCIPCGERLEPLQLAYADAPEADRLASLREANPRRGRPGGTGRGG